MILLLEDDPARLMRFSAVISAVFPGIPSRSWREAHTMIAEMPSVLADATLISLDHDLEPIAGDPGDGLIVARWLVEHAAPRPVIIHTSNSERGSWMVGEFELAGWPFARVLPFGDRWIEEDWAAAARDLLNA